MNPENQLNVYATEEDADGPDSSVNMVEFRSQTAPNSCSTYGNAWVELYDDQFWQGPGIRIDYEDHLLEPYHDFNSVEEHGDTVRAARWCIPKNWRYTIFQHNNFRGLKTHLNGQNRLAEYATLITLDRQASSGRFECRRNNRWTSSVEFCERYIDSAIVVNSLSAKH